MEGPGDAEGTGGPERRAAEWLRQHENGFRGSLSSRLARYSARIDPARLRRSSGRLVKWLVIAAVVGAGTGLVVVAFQFVVLDGAWERLIAAPGWVQVATPGFGVALAWLTLRQTGARNSYTAEEYVRVFHDRRARLRPADLASKFVAGAFTIGLGGSMGLEGPSLLIGGTIGDTVQSRFSRLFDREEAKVMLVSGAAAGIAAVFKAPLTGLVFAMEVPYRDDVARHVLGPALVASASGYLVEASIRGVEPLIPIVGTTRFGLGELGLSVVLGLVAGLVARALIVNFRRAERWMRRLSPVWRLLVAAAVLAAAGAASRLAFHAPLALGPGERAITAAAVGRLTAWALLALMVLKAVATAVTAGAGGVGGLFFPLVVVGTALGAAFERLVAGSGTLFPLVGMASLLGSAYHTPLAGVSFVAEATGRAGFVVPTFVATAAAYATVGGMSISHQQRFRRAGPVERMLEVPVTEVATLERATVPPDETLEDFVHGSLTRRFKSYAVVDGEDRYVGMIELDTVMAIPEEQWPARDVATVARHDHPVGTAEWTVYEAIDAMAAADVDVLPVLDGSGRLIGLVRTSEVFRLSEVVDRLRTDFRRPSP